MEFKRTRCYLFNHDNILCTYEKTNYNTKNQNGLIIHQTEDINENHLRLRYAGFEICIKTILLDDVKTTIQ